MASLRLVGVLVVVLLLSGCVSVVSLPAPRLSDAEIVELNDARLEQAWEYSGLSVTLKGTDTPVQVVAAEDWAHAYVVCMNAAGYDEYLVMESGGSYGDYSAVEDREERAAIVVCSTRVMLDPALFNQLNHAELDLWYDYFEQVLVPCLALQQVEVINAPTRAEFQNTFGGWNPYWAVHERDIERANTDSALHSLCPPQPPGYPDPGMW